MSALILTCHGCRGSSPVAGPAFDRYGGFTTCFEIAHTRDHRILIDAGTGIHHLLREAESVWRYTIFLTHVHWDHIQGIPFFVPLYNPKVDVIFHGRNVEGLDIGAAIEGVMRPPWFPVSFHGSPSRKTFGNLDGGVRVDDLKVSWAALHHPSGVTGYRFERGGRSLVIATDVEAGDPEGDVAVRELARGADLLVHDAQYVPGEYEGSKVGWGHSTWQHAVAVAKDAGVKKLLLTSHDPDRTDDEIDVVVAAARRAFPATEAAYCGMTIPV